MTKQYRSTVGVFETQKVRRHDERDDFNCNITNFQFLSYDFRISPAYGVFNSQFVQYARACYSYRCFILRATRLSNKLPKQGYVKERSEIVIQEVLWSIPWYYHTMSNSLLLNDIMWPDHIQSITPDWSDFVPNSIFSRILIGFHRTFATGVACRQWTVTPPDTWPLIGKIICSDRCFAQGPEIQGICLIFMASEL